MGSSDTCICDFGNAKVGVINLVYISTCINYVILFHPHPHARIWKIQFQIHTVLN